MNKIDELTIQRETILRQIDELKKELFFVENDLSEHLKNTD